MEMGEVGPASLPHCPHSPLGDCSAMEKVAPGCHCVPSPQRPCRPCQGDRRDWEGQCHLGGGMLPVPAQTPGWLSALAMGLAGIPPPKSHPPQGGHRDTCACFSLAGGQGGRFSLSLQPKNPSAAACPAPHVPLSQRDGAQPLSVCPLSLKLSLLSWACCLWRNVPVIALPGTQMPAGAHQDAQTTPIPSLGCLGLSL